MNLDAKIYVAGHTGLVGSALCRKLKAEGYKNIITRSRSALDLERQASVEEFFAKEAPEYVFLAAAKVGGIWANNTYPAEFIYKNLVIQSNVIHSAWKAGVKRLLFLGSSCIYPRECAQPMREEYLLTGPLEATNEPYGVAKIAGVKMCQSYNRQYGTSFISVMPTNLYGPNDNFDLENSHVLPALIRKFHLAELAARGDWEAIIRGETRFGPIPDDFRQSLISISKLHGHDPPLPAASRQLPPPSVVLWGSGTPKREFLHADDLADACFFLMKLRGEKVQSLLTADHLPLINIGWCKDISVKELALLIREIVGFTGEIVFDKTKPDGTPRKLLNVTKLAELDWKPKISLRKGIEMTYNWYLQEAQT